MICKDCEALKAQNAALRARVKALRRIIEDMSGPALELDDDPYEDETWPDWMIKMEEDK